MTILRPADLRGLAALLGSQEPHAVVPPCWHWGLLLDPVIPGNLDEHGYIVPGLGDAGDRLYGLAE